MTGAPRKVDACAPQTLRAQELGQPSCCKYCTMQLCPWMEARPPQVDMGKVDRQKSLEEGSLNMERKGCVRATGGGVRHSSSSGKGCEARGGVEKHREGGDGRG